MSKREEILQSLIGTKTTLEIITELRKLPIESDGFHVIPFGVTVYRIEGYCDECSMYDSRFDKCEDYRGKGCPPRTPHKGVYIGNDDSSFGTKTFFSKEEAEQYIKLNKN